MIHDWDHKMRRLLPSGRAVSVSFENHGALGLTFKENAGVYRLEISQYLSTNQGPKDLQPGTLRSQEQGFRALSNDTCFAV